MKKEEIKKVSEATVEDALDYSGVAIDKADNDKTDSDLVKEMTKEINNNPRNNDL